LVTSWSRAHDQISLDRILPKRLVDVELPSINYAPDVVDAVWAALDAVGKGQISPSDGAALTAMVEACVRVISAADHEIRLNAIEMLLKQTAL
jgi:hypothetical protein